MNKKVQMFSKMVYGVKKIYPANDQARLLAELINQKSFGARDLALIVALGFEIEPVAAPGSLNLQVAA